MLIRILEEEDVKALERVRRRDGDRSGVATVLRLIRESDAKGARSPLESGTVSRIRDEGARRAARKGARS
jgi:hypothetical protein